MATTCGSTDDALLTPALPSHLPDSAFLISSPPTNPGQSRWDHSLSRKHNVESAVEQCEVVVPSQGQRDDSTVRPQCHLSCLHKCWRQDLRDPDINCASKGKCVKKDSAKFGSPPNLFWRPLLQRVWKTSRYICQLKTVCLGTKLCPRPNFHNGFCDAKTKERGTHFSQLKSMSGGSKESLPFRASCTFDLWIYLLIEYITRSPGTLDSVLHAFGTHAVWPRLPIHSIGWQTWRTNGQI